MARKLVVEVLADTTAFTANLKEATVVSEQFSGSVTAGSKVAAQAVVAASVKTTESLRLQAVAYREIAAAAETGSAEQIAAARLAEKAELRLAASMGVVAAESTQTAARTSLATRELERFGRGALSGTGLMHGFGRSLAFASGGFIAFEGVSKFLSDSVKAAIDAGVAQRSLTAQMKASGESFAASSDAIEQANLGLAKFGFTSEDAEHALTVLERGTGNITRALSLEQVSADLARAKNIDLASAANVVAKVFGGQETALRRAVPGLDKTAHGMDLVRQAQQRLTGQAVAATTPGERFNATLHDTEVILGTALLPKLNTGLTFLTDWFDKINRATDKTDGFAGSVHRLAERLGELGDNAATAGHDTKSAWDQIPDVVQQALFGVAGKGGGGVGAFAALTNTLGGVFTSGFRAVGLGSLVRQPRPAGGGNLFSPGFQLPSFGLPTPPPFIPHDLPTGQAAAPILGRGALTPAQRNQLALSAAALTKTTTDDLAALVTQRQLLAKGIATETARLNQATTAGGAKKFADNLQSQQDKLAGVNSRILEITKKGAADAGKTGAELAAQRNTFFDNAITRMLDRVTDITSVGGQISRLQQISGLITQRIAATKDVTRKLTLEDQLVSVLRTIKGDREQLQQGVIDALGLKLDRAGLTKSVSDDIAVLKETNTALAEQQKQLGYTADRERQIIANLGQIAGLEQQQRDARKQLRDAARQTLLDQLQFNVDRTQLTATLTDDLKALQAQQTAIKKIIATQGLTLKLQQDLLAVELAIQAKKQEIADARAGEKQARADKAAKQAQTKIDAANLTVAKAGLTETLKDDLAANQNLLAVMKKTGASAIDIVNQQKTINDVKAQLADQIAAGKKGDDKAADSADQANQSSRKLFKHLNATAFVNTFGAGLTREQKRRLEIGLAMTGPGGTLPAGHTGQFTAGITIHGGVHMHGVQDVPGLENQIAKRAKARPYVRRGARG